MPLIYALQLTGAVGLYWGVRGKPDDLAFLGRWAAVLALIVSLVFWDAW
ncbi:hypothetical protein [Streptomyces sp. Act143]|nr:hypothetical protein [Streptomyces sp. Act143]